MTRERSALVLAGLLAVAGAVHLVRPQVFDDIVPESLPGPSRAWNYGAGVAELAVAATIANPRTRRLGGGLAAVLFVAVFPGNLSQFAQRRDGFGLDTDVKRLVRLFFQPALVWAAVWSTRSPRS